jgi:hypothetical protein
MPDPEEPRGARLEMPRGYEVASGDELLPWAWAVERLERAENYWLATTRPDGRPHVTPVWGVWVDGALYFDGIPTARWARNLAANPALAAHLESGDAVVVIEGTAEDLVTEADLGASIVAAWQAKYGRLLPRPATSGILRLRPRAARAWSRFPDDATRWRFAGASDEG